MRRIRTKIIGSLLVAFGAGAVAMGQLPVTYNDCKVVCGGCGDDGVIMHFSCHPARHCCTFTDCETCTAAGTCCPSRPDVCCQTGYTAGGAPFASCTPCDPL